MFTSDVRALRIDGYCPFSSTILLISVKRPLSLFHNKLVFGESELHGAYIQCTVIAVLLGFFCIACSILAASTFVFAFPDPVVQLMHPDLFGCRLYWCPMRLDNVLSQGPRSSIFYLSAPSTPSVRVVAGLVGMPVRSTEYGVPQCRNTSLAPLFPPSKRRSSHGVITST